jgi:hypothetical protein
LRAALQAFYGYYRATGRMWTALFRDEPEVPALQGPMNGFREFLATIAADLVQALAPPEPRLRSTAATVSHALQFQAWASLSAAGLSDVEAADLATSWVSAAAADIAMVPREQLQPARAAKRA